MNYTITKEQIESIAQGGGKKKIKEFFPDVFETKLEVGKWYKGDLLLGCYKGNGKCYGFYDDDFGDDFYMSENSGYIPATEAEVKQALIAEAKKMGFAYGIKFKVNNGTDGFCKCDCEFDFINNALISNGWRLFKDGQWAEIIKDEITPKQFLLDLIGNKWVVEIDKKKYLNSVFYFKDDSLLFELEKSDEVLYLWYSYSKIWNPISTKFSLNYEQTQQLIKETVEEHFNLRDVTPNARRYKTIRKVEEHFNLRYIGK